MFGRIARRYDLMNTLMTGGQDAAWRHVVAATIDARASDTVLDVGTGTGKLLEAIAQRSPGARVVGVDFALPMLRAAPRGLRLAAADGLRLPFADRRFDAVTSAFVLRNLADMQAGIAEQVRVLRPGGQLLVLETTPGPAGLLGVLIRLYFRRGVPLLGGLITGDAAAYTYLPESTVAFVEPERLASLMREAGLRDVVVKRLGFGAVALTRGWID